MSTAAAVAKSCWAASSPTRKLRDDIVLATKFSFSGGNGRKNLHRAIEGSLRRLGTEFIDLYWLHVWDAVTPAEELLQSMGDLIRSGKIRYFGLSDVPAWYVARMGTLAQAHGLPGPIALQLVYSLAERVIEHEHIPAARELGMGITPWSPPWSRLSDRQIQIATPTERSPLVGEGWIPTVSHFACSPNGTGEFLTSFAR